MPGSGYHGTLVNSMHPLHVICFSSVWVYLFINFFVGCLSQWTCQEEKGQVCTQEFKEKTNFICRRLRNLKGRKSASALLSLSGQKWGKNTAGVGRETAAVRVWAALLSTSNLRRHYRNCARRLWKEMSPSLIEMGFFFFSLLPLYYRSADGLFSRCDKRAQSRAQGDTRAGRRRWRSDQKIEFLRKKSCRQKNKLISSGCRRMEMSWKAEYLINKMLKYWGFGSVWPVCALCVQAIYIYVCVCVCLRLYVCILNMLLLSPAGRTQHCILPSLVSWFVLFFLTH